MLHTMQSLLGFTMGATDGEIGKVKDFYFDDQTWRVRYLVVETGNWLFGRKVLLSPVAIQSINWDEKVFPVNLSMDQIKHSPDIDTEKPVSQQQDAELHSHYSWPVNTGAGVGFMTTGMVGGVVSPGVSFQDRIADEVRNHENDTISDRGPEMEKQSGGDLHLRSYNAFEDFTVMATDGELGEASDFLIDSNSWNIPFLIIETGNWYSGSKVLAPTNTIESIEGEDSQIRINQGTSYFNNNPEFNESLLTDQEAQRQIFNFYHTR